MSRTTERYSRYHRVVSGRCSFLQPHNPLLSFVHLPYLRCVCLLLSRFQHVLLSHGRRLSFVVSDSPVFTLQTYFVSDQTFSYFLLLSLLLTHFIRLHSIWSLKSRELSKFQFIRAYFTRGSIEVNEVIATFFGFKNFYLK